MCNFITVATGLVGDSASCFHVTRQVNSYHHFRTKLMHKTDQMIVAAVLSVNKRERCSMPRGEVWRCGFGGIRNAFAQVFSNQSSAMLCSCSESPWSCSSSSDSCYSWVQKVSVIFFPISSLRSTCCNSLRSSYNAVELSCTWQSFRLKICLSVLLLHLLE